jgi:hypothetical protein
VHKTYLLVSSRPILQKYYLADSDETWQIVMDVQYSSFVLERFKVKFSARNPVIPTGCS